MFIGQPPPSLLALILLIILIILSLKELFLSIIYLCYGNQD